jgi:DNA-binding transcriptional LysR family regulator
MASLEYLAAYVAVLDNGSLTAAARRLGRSVQSVSRAVTALEQELGVTLIARTTRHIRPTAAGVRLADRLRAILLDIANAQTEAVDEVMRLAGPVRIGVSTLFGPEYVLPVLAGLLQRHPDISLEVMAADRHVDLASEKLDLAIRIGELAEHSLVARRLGKLRRVIFAAPGYLALRGRPSKPQHLRDHDCILRLAPGETERWSLRLGYVEVRGRLRSDSASARNRAAEMGLGIGMAPLYQVRALIDAGQLELVLTEFEPPTIPVHMVWLEGALPRRVRAVVDVLAARLSVAGL